MGGIAGFQGNFDAGVLARMSEAIAHRGPDGCGTFHRPEDAIGLTHRRLAIIDLSHAADQPMCDDAAGLAIVFNGEIYNYRELRAELICDGYSFRTQSDTEVLLRLYARDGEAMLTRLNGIFAFAIWDAGKRELFLARDGLGVKPLYYAQTPQGFLFASEIKALLQEPMVSRDIDPTAVAHHLTYLWCPAPRTMLAGVKKLEPGMAMGLREGKVVRHWRFYDLPYARERGALSESSAVAAVRETVEQAVGRQMVADVPVGAFLSGGLDSSAVVAFARQHTKARLQCFTIALDGGGADVEGMVDDLPYAQRVAAHLGVDLHTVTVGPEMVKSLPDMIYHLDEPQADPAALSALFICKLAREHGIKVLLSGAGGDDIFTGYRRHVALQQERYWAWLPRTARRGLSRLTSRLSTGAPALRRVRKAFEYAALDGRERLASSFYWLGPDSVQALVAPELRNALADGAVAEPLISALDRLPKGATSLDGMLYLEGKFFLADHNLNYTDKMSMAHGVEVRVPLLDRDLVALAAGLPDGMKQRGRTGKWVFKKAMEPYLPHDVIYRPKTGFGAPLRRWMRHDLRELLGDVLSAESLTRRGLFEPVAVQRLMAANEAGRVDASYTLLSLLCIEIWCRTFLDGSARS